MKREKIKRSTLPPSVFSQLERLGQKLSEEEMEKSIRNIPENSPISYLWVMPLGRISSGAKRWHKFWSRNRSSIMRLQQKLTKVRREDQIEVRLGKWEKDPKKFLKRISPKSLLFYVIVNPNGAQPDVYSIDTLESAEWLKRVLPEEETEIREGKKS